MNSINDVELMRGGNAVSTQTGAFGQSLRETRLTAVLGYLMAHHPEPFLKLFGFRGIPQRICLEMQHENGRSDILVETTAGIGIIEAKVDATDPLTQSHRYPARWRALITHRTPKITNNRARYVTWQELSRMLDQLSRSGPLRIRTISKDLFEYLREHRMTRERSSVEIYAREINEPVTLALFLQAQLYGCTYQPSSRLAEALYFAPHFGRHITNEQPGIKIGISYIARIEFVGHAVTWREFSDLMTAQRGRSWWKHHEDLLGSGLTT